ncbi:MAG: hypothetical protein JO246_18030 [Frankiaceae bacterium]|nr:hypothetical protein [Frankiaceae bacterium]MBV9869655.1 hypothetical protein [Frankiaceae bacterium]
MTDLATQPPRYGTLNLDYIASWDTIPDDEPMWALNLMHYRAVADYRDGRESTITGQEADDRYAPFEPLAAVGARIVLVAPVVEQLIGDVPVWDRIAIVRYPSRRAMLEMESSPAFRELHVHKEAGMASTIVAATYPRVETIYPVRLADEELLLLQLVADDAAPGIATPGCRPLATFRVDAVIIGDGRTWAAARWHAIPAADVGAVRDAIATQDWDDGCYAVVMQPFINELAAALAEVSSSS